MTQYFAKGGGCFIAGTHILTTQGERPIETLKQGDMVISYNEKTKENETSTIGSIETYQRDEYYTINGSINATGDHPFYTTNGIRPVEQLQIGTRLIGREGRIIEVTSLSKGLYPDTTVYNLLDVEPNNNYYAQGVLVHNKGGISSGSRSTSTRSTSTRTSTSKTSTPKQSTKPGSTVKTKSGRTVKSSTAKPTNKAFTKEKGIVGTNGYSPKFTGGYSAPEGSVVYYRDNSFIDYLPWIYLFNHSDPARPENQQATVVQPDGKQVVTKPVAQGTDGMAVLNWILLILIAAAIIGGIVWGVNKLTTKKATPRNAW